MPAHSDLRNRKEGNDIDGRNGKAGPDRTGAARAIPLSVHLLALSLFAMGSAEFLMGGILPMIAADLRITLPAAGALISAFAVGALIGGPAFAILALRWPGRRTLFLSQMAFMAATVVSLLAQGYWSILTARFAMGLAYACFWAVAAAMAVQLAARSARQGACHRRKRLDRRDGHRRTRRHIHQRCGRLARRLLGGGGGNGDIRGGRPGSAAGKDARLPPCRTWAWNCVP